jgi:hypothetical protein
MTWNAFADTSIFDYEESLQLQAAIIATQVQRIVYERYGAKDNHEKKLKAAAAALHAAELLLPTLIEAARQMTVVDFEAFRGTMGSLVLQRRQRMSRKNLDMAPEKEPMLDRNQEQPFISEALAGALDAIDRGTLALDLGYSASSHAERLERARSARDAFADALEQLDQQDAEVQSSEAWRFWRAEARSGNQDADDRVVDLGSR